MTPILSQHGNVIAADFRPRQPDGVILRATTEILFCDGYVSLVRTTTQFGNEPTEVTHGMIDLASGRLVTL